MEQLVIGIFIFFVGAALGSFAGATAWRLHEKKNMTTDRSECEHCHHKLSAIDLMPVFGWLMLRGKCRYCKKPIGWLTFLLELAAGTAALLLFLFWPYGFGGGLEISLFVLWIIALAPLFILLAYDWRWGYLPDVIMWPTIALGVGIFVLSQLVMGTPAVQWPLGLIYSIAPAAGFYGLLYVFSKGKWIGLGDVKYGIFMGLVLDWKQCLLAVFLANLLASIAILPTYKKQALKHDSRVPFGPFLIVATIIAFLWGNQLISWYLSLSGITTL